VHVGSVQDCRRVPFLSWADGGRLREALAAGGRRPPPRPRAAAAGGMGGAVGGIVLASSSSTGWSRDLQDSCGQWPSPVVPEQRANTKSFVRLDIFCDSTCGAVRSAATGWSGQRRPIGRLAVPLPHPYQIVSPCRLAGAPSTRGSPTRCTPG